MFFHVQRCAAPIGSIRHYFPSHGRRTNRRLAPPSGIQPPPRIAPRCHHYWMNIEYHYRFTGSSQDNLPQLFLAGWTRYAPFMAVVYRTGKENDSSKFYRWSSRTRRIALPPFLSGGPQTDVVRCRIFRFQGALTHCWFQCLIFKRGLKRPSLLSRVQRGGENQKNNYFIIFRSFFKILCFRLLTPFYYNTFTG